MGCVTQKNIWALLNMNNFKLITIWQVYVLFIKHLLFPFILNANLLFKLIYDTYQIYLKNYTLLNK